ncbi:MAG: hypothetical protein AVDCRST_MAG18-3148 [uncultured Thermomicrobiales bacterium]|uniref:Uncharacterized protein n=1 Tax=uncultured Thermomicrobiales bacterium TaxID=1645740 RepID=A0A6J4VJL3_9BACT|nr:MAG: hypothetical protein AVDCRST_MAG18-3148 [uncultured Thermomicrobiales bacterium]
MSSSEQDGRRHRAPTRLAATRVAHYPMGIPRRPAAAQGVRRRNHPRTLDARLE